MELEHLLQQGKISLMNGEWMKQSYGPLREEYAPWTALSHTPRKERAYGGTPREAVEALLIKLDML